MLDEIMICNGHNDMQCPRCQRSLAKEDPVIRIRARSDYRRPAPVVGCLVCSEAWADSRSARCVEYPCEHCGRPVLIRGNKIKRIACSPYCRGQLDNALARARRAKDRREHSCQICSAPFDPSRRDAKYCSNACRQRAYRNPLLTFT
jgi:hypothetical protein